MFRYGQLTCAAANISVQIQNRNENDKQIDETTDKRSLIDNTVQQEKIDEKLFGKLQAIQSEQSKCPHINDKEYDSRYQYTKVQHKRGVFIFLRDKKINKAIDT